MADDAFALSPINARASMPTEADYEAICGAFMETARGRWFLGEYARRNRNADTRMVLDAVARIEAIVASQKAPASPSLPDYLPDISDLVADAQRRVLGALPKNDMRPTTEPIQRAAGILRDVAWTLRESGADTRVCDLLDVQAKAIVDGCTRMHGDQVAPDVPAAVASAFDSLMRRISALAGAHAPRRIPRPQKSSEATAEARPDEPSPAVAEPAASRAVTLDVVATDAPLASSELPAETVEIAEAQAKPEAANEHQAAPPEARAPLTPVEVDLQAGLSEGLEITEIDPGEKVTEPEAGEQPALPETQPAEAEAAEPAPAASEASPSVAETPRSAAEVAEPEPAVTAEPEAVKKPAPSSLGQAALDGGVVTPLRSRYSEALAPIRRMSQAEKIAFFS